MKSKRPSPLVFTAGASRTPVAGGGPGAMAEDPGAPPRAETISVPTPETDIDADIDTELQIEPPIPDTIDLHAFEIRAPDPIGAVAPADERLIQSQDASAALPLLNPSAALDETIAAPSPRPVIAAAAVASAIWALAPIMFAWGYRHEVVPFNNDIFALTVLALMAIGPMALVWVAAYVVHQGRRLAAETRRAQALANSLMQPAALAARGAGSAVEQVRAEILNATSAADRARGELLALRDVLAAESARLVEATQGSHRTALALTDSLGGERERMSQMASTLDTQAASVTDAIARQAHMVAEASDLAETQLREAEAALTARAADLA
ncbi:MAG: polar localization protein TipN, partial [Caulobacteraceae bacterium]|nr:polar localization protein TipN [Caulobacteraceae bacterium]